MKCPACQASHIGTITTRQHGDGETVRQKRCHICSHRWITLEQQVPGLVSFKSWPPVVELVDP
jgi:transcriptional regulator NrdR family protein